MRFILTVLGIWGGMHAYVWGRVVLYCKLAWLQAALLGVAFAVGTVLPLAGMVVYRHGPSAPTLALRSAGVFWMGAFWILFSLSVAHDLWNGTMWFVGRLVPWAARLTLTGPRSVLVLLGLTCVASLYAMVEARWFLAVERVEVPAAGLERRRRIAHLSDLHLGAWTSRRWLEGIVETVGGFSPDVVVITGDVVDDPAGAMRLVPMLRGLEARCAVYACPGNHEHYGDRSAVDEFFRSSGIRLLRGEAAEPCDGLVVVGLDEFVSPPDPEALLPRQGRFVVLLRHRPLIDPRWLAKMDLQLSGHTHAGQIFPAALLVAAVHRYRRGLYRLEGDKYLYVSRGTGTWGPPMRLFSRPEVVVLDLVPRR